jgi:predicted HicB family RNase H-like nuclease
MKTVVHKGYHGTIEVNTEDYSLHGKILFIEEDIHYKGGTFAELELDFQQAVEKHIENCLGKGEEPPFS